MPLENLGDFLDDVESLSFGGSSLPNADAIELWVSTTGSNDGDFSLLTTLPDAGGSFSFVQTPVVSQQVYLYKARRFRASDQAYSAFSPIASARGLWPVVQETTSMPTATGIQSKFGLGVQDTALVADAAAQAQRLLDYKSSSVDQEFDDADHDTLSGITAPISSVPGVSKTQGPVKVTITPEGICELLAARFGVPTSTAVTGVTGAFDHVFKCVVNQPKLATFVEKKGPLILAYPGGVNDEISVSVDKTQNTPVEMDVALMMLNYLVYNAEADVALDTAAMDVTEGFGSAQAAVKIAGAIVDAAKTFSLKSKANFKPRDVLNLKRGPVSFYKTRASNDGSIGLYFEDDTSLKVFMGVLAGAAKPYGATKKIRTVSIGLLLQSEDDGTGFKYEVEFTFPKASYKKNGKPVQGDDAIMQNIDFKGYQDAANGTSFMVRVRNKQAASAFSTAAAPIAQVPQNDVTSYHNP